MKAIIKRVFISDEVGKMRPLKVKLKNKPVDICQARRALRIKYNVEKVYFEYETM